MPDRGTALNVFAPVEVVTPGDDMRPRHGAEFVRPDDAGEPHKILDRVFVGAPGAAIGDVGEPLELRRHLCQALKLGGGQKPVAGRNLGWKMSVVHGTA